MTIGALGIVYGDIGTRRSTPWTSSPAGAGGAQTPADVLGGVSLVIWTITLIVAIKYAILVLRAQNDGEGGVFALYGLLQPNKRGTTLLLWSLMLGAGLLFGDGMITPAISVLSAVEGLQVATPALGRHVIPITIGLLTALFAIQFKGTSGIGIMFGPVLMIWFLLSSPSSRPADRTSPRHSLCCFQSHSRPGNLRHAGLFDALLILSVLMLVVTGGEAMYADVGDSGAQPIRASWFAVVYPARCSTISAGRLSVERRAGRGRQAFLQPGAAATALSDGLARHRRHGHRVAGADFRSLFAWLASDPVGLPPRFDLLHTHQAHAGQVYVPFVNWSLCAGCILLVVTFGSSSALAAAYGLAVSGVMVITSVAMFPIARRYWNWGTASTGLVWGTLTAVNASFLVASLLKFVEGGYVPLSVGIAVFVAMTTWRWGRKATFAAYSAKSTMTIAELVALHRECKVFMERNAVLMSPKPMRLPTDHTPALMQMLWERHGILPRNLILVEVTHCKVPYVRDNRYRVTVFDHDRHRGCIIGVELSFGFMEEPNVERVLEEMARHKEIDLPTDRRQWIVHVSHENLVPGRRMGLLKRLRFRLFMLLRLVSQPAYYYYGLGDEVQLSVEIIPVRVR